MTAYIQAHSSVRASDGRQPLEALWRFGTVPVPGDRVLERLQDSDRLPWRVPHHRANLAASPAGPTSFDRRPRIFDRVDAELGDEHLENILECWPHAGASKWKVDRR